MDNGIKLPEHNDSKIITFGLSVIFVIFFLSGGWMATAPLSSAAVAVGQVSAGLNKKTIQHLEGGIVEKIFVKDGDKIQKGDILIKLQDVHIRGKIEQLHSRISGVKSILLSKKKRLVSINEEILEWEDLYRQKLVDKLRIRELKREKDLIDGDIANTQFEIAENEDQIRVYEDTLKRTKVIAPISGTVVGMEIQTLGGVISSGVPILEIVPSDSKLIVLAQMQTTDVDKVKIGLLSDIRFSAFNLQQAHVVEGKVIHISADSMLNESNGAPYYEIKIELTQQGEKQLKEYGFELVAGMPAEVMIKTGNRTALSYLVKPFKDMLARSFNEE